MRLTLTNFSRQDFSSDAPSWIDPLMNFITRSIGKIGVLLNGGLTFGDNIKSDQLTATLNTSATYSTGDFTPISFSISFDPINIFLTNVTEIGSAANTYTSPVTIAPNWTYSSGTKQITIYYITGLQNSTQYSIKVLII